jgi:hypothetical protein
VPLTILDPQTALIVWIFRRAFGTYRLSIP